MEQRSFLAYLFRRPIGVLLTTACLFLAGVFLYFQLPISLLPSVEVPQISIRIPCTDASSSEIEELILKPIREQFLTLSGLEELESKAADQLGYMELTFTQGTDMGVRYIEISERLDRLSMRFPKNAERPQILHKSVSDIPILKLHILPKKEEDLWKASEFTEKFLKRHIEGIKGVSFVDMNGLQKKMIQIKPHNELLTALHIPLDNIYKSIKDSQFPLGNVRVKDGQYQYHLKANREIVSSEDLKNLPVLSKEGQVFPLYKLVSIQDTLMEAQGYHLYGNTKAIVLNIYKQEGARLPELMPDLLALRDRFEEEYPDFEYKLSENQSEILEISIDNLKSSAIIGGILVFLIMFAFSPNAKNPLLIGLSLPLSLGLTFLCFYVWKIPITILSLSGLALGLGMEIDNAIIVIDSIEQKKSGGLSRIEACIQGVQTVFLPLIGSVLTTLLVFLPLIFLNGSSGVLFKDQALSIACILGVSLGISFVILPLLWMMVSRLFPSTSTDSLLFVQIEKIYKKVFKGFMNRAVLGKLFFFVGCILGCWMLTLSETQYLPDLKQKDGVIDIYWNAPIDVEENVRRTLFFASSVKGQWETFHADLGIPSFMVLEESPSIQQAHWYFSYASAEERKKAIDQLVSNIQRLYPEAICTIREAKNPVNQLFNSDEPYLEARFRRNIPDASVWEAMNFPDSFPDFSVGAGLEQQKALFVSLKRDKMNAYELSEPLILSAIKERTGGLQISDVRSYSEVIPVNTSKNKASYEEILQTETVLTPQGISLPLSEFIDIQAGLSWRYLLADRNGAYLNLNFSKGSDLEKTMEVCRSYASSKGWMVHFKGSVFKTQEMYSQLQLIFLITLVLLYLVLVALFESLKLPLLILSVLPLGIAGTGFLFFLLEIPMNIMSGIGLVVVLGIMVNDAILKVETIERLKEDLPLEEAVAMAGKMRLKAILTTSLTTILAVLPILWGNGMGAELQAPMVISIIGGLGFGTFAALYWIPLLYNK